MSQPVVTLGTFGEDHFGQAKLGDKRRTRSLVDLANRFARHPGGTLPQKCQDPNVLRRCYDLMNCDAVTHERVLEPHVQRVLRLACEQDGVVLILHDVTELDFSGLTSLHDQLGQIGNGFGHGYECLNSLAVVPGHRNVLGLVSQILHVRPHVPKNETQTQRRDRESRESRLWLQAVDNVAAAVARGRRSRTVTDGHRLVDVADRGSDTFEFLDHEDRLGRFYVVRSNHNRGIRPGHDGQGERTTLHPYLRTLPPQDRRPLSIPEREDRPARKTTVCLAWAAVEVQLPENERGHYRPVPLKVWAVRVWEPEPPAGAEAVEWFLLTNLPVQTVAQAWEKVDWYCCRWVIEELHKAQKTGCAIEAPQFTRVARLQPMIALLSVVAVLLLNLRNLSRSEQAEEPATTVIDEEYVEVLSGWRYREQRRLSVREFFLALARLGGHQNRKGDGQPGWLVLWRGWTALQLMVEGARAIRHLKRAGGAHDPPPKASRTKRSPKSKR